MDRGHRWATGLYYLPGSSQPTFFGDVFGAARARDEAPDLFCSDFDGGCAPTPDATSALVAGHHFGLAVADADRNGALDVFFGGRGGPPTILHATEGADWEMVYGPAGATIQSEGKTLSLPFMSAGPYATAPSFVQVQDRVVEPTLHNGAPCHGCRHLLPYP